MKNCLVDTNYVVPKRFCKCGKKTINFVNEALEIIKQNPDLSNEELFELLSKNENSSQYYIIYSTEPSQKGVLLYHGADSFVSQSDMCGNEKPPVGENLWNYKALDGLYSVRVFYKIAEQKSRGWFSYYWVNSKGRIAPKYDYIVNVPERNFFISSGFYINCC